MLQILCKTPVAIFKIQIPTNTKSKFNRFIDNVMIHRKIIFGFPILTWVPKND